MNYLHLLEAFKMSRKISFSRYALPLGTDIENCLGEIEGEASDLTSFQ